MLLKFPTTKTHFTFSAPAAQLIAAEMSQAHEQRTPFFILKALAAFLYLYPLVYPAGNFFFKNNPKLETRKKIHFLEYESPNLLLFSFIFIISHF
jgi:hypothetical protein